jgi:hypothetical protein
MFCPVFPETIFISCPSLHTYHSDYNPLLPPKRTQSCKYFTPLIIIYTTLLLVDGIRHATKLFICGPEGGGVTNPAAMYDLCLVLRTVL